MAKALTAKPSNWQTTTEKTDERVRTVTTRSYSGMGPKRTLGPDRPASNLVSRVSGSTVSGSTALGGGST